MGTGKVWLALLHGGAAVGPTPLLAPTAPAVVVPRFPRASPATATAAAADDGDGRVVRWYAAIGGARSGFPALARED